MANISVPIFVESRYKLNRKRIKETVRRVLGEQHIDSDIEVSVAIIGDRKMRKLNKMYRKQDQTTNVLSFSQNEGMPIPTVLTGGRSVIRLGDIVISYPQVIIEAAREEMMVDEKIEQLVEHGLLHLLGLHHE
jgi:probable rRNA maturation factor